jgi:hypothetical protein
MAWPRFAGIAACAALALVALPPPAARGGALTSEELSTACAQTEGSAQCARKVEEVQLQRLPNLAVREGNALKVSLYPSGIATFTDTEALNGGRAYSLWDFVSEINAAILFVTDGGNASFLLLQRAGGHRIDLPAEPRVSPDRARLATADFCASSCINELAVWRVTREGVQKELAWKPRETWSDAGVTWKDAGTMVVEYTVEGAAASARFERRLTDPGWLRPGPP